MNRRAFLWAALCGAVLLASAAPRESVAGGEAEDRTYFLHVNGIT